MVYDILGLEMISKKNSIKKRIDIKKNLLILIKRSRFNNQRDFSTVI